MLRTINKFTVIFKLKFTNSTSSASIDVKSIVNSNGIYFLDIKFNSTSGLTVVSGTSRIKFTVLNKLKLNHVKLSMTNPVEKADEKEMYRIIKMQNC